MYSPIEGSIPQNLLDEFRNISIAFAQVRKEFRTQIKEEIGGIELPEIEFPEFPTLEDSQAYRDLLRETQDLRQVSLDLEERYRLLIEETDLKIRNLLSQIMTPGEIQRLFNQYEKEANSLLGLVNNETKRKVESRLLVMEGEVNAKLAETSSKLLLVDDLLIEIDISLAEMEARILGIEALLLDFSLSTEFNSELSYSVGALVTYLGGMYVAIQATVAPSPLPTDLLYWEHIGAYGSIGQALQAYAVRLSTLDTQVVEIDGNLAAIGTSITQLETAVSDVEIGLTSKASITYVDTTKTEIFGSAVNQFTQIQAEFTTIDTGLASKATLTELNTAITGVYAAEVTAFINLNARFTSTDTAINSKASTTDLTNAVAGVYAAEVTAFTNIAAEFNSVDTSLNSKASLTDLSTAITNVYGSEVIQFSLINARFTSTDAAINSKASITQLNEAKTDIYGAAVSSFINIAAEFVTVETGLASKASITQLNEAVTGIYGSAVSQFTFIDARFATTDTAINSKASITQLNEAKTEIYGAATSTFTSINASFSAVQAEIAELSGTPPFASTATYEVGDLAIYMGKLYRALQAMSDPSPLPTDILYWQLIGDFSSLGEAVAQHSSDIAVLESDIITKASITQLNEAKTEIFGSAVTQFTQINAEFTAVDTSLTSKVDSLTFNTAITNVYAAELIAFTNINLSFSGLQSDVNSKASTTDLTTAITNVYQAEVTAFQNINTRFTTTDTTVNTKASLTELNTAITNVYQAEVSQFFNINAEFNSVDLALATKATSASVEEAKADIYGSTVSQFSLIDARFTTTDTAINTKASITSLNEAKTEIYNAAVTSFTNIEAALYHPVTGLANTRATIDYVDQVEVDIYQASVQSFTGINTALNAVAANLVNPLNVIGWTEKWDIDFTQASLGQFTVWGLPVVALRELRTTGRQTRSDWFDLDSDGIYEVTADIWATGVGALAFGLNVTDPGSDIITVPSVREVSATGVVGGSVNNDPYWLSSYVGTLEWLPIRCYLFGSTADTLVSLPPSTGVTAFGWKLEPGRTRAQLRLLSGYGVAAGETHEVYWRNVSVRRISPTSIAGVTRLDTAISNVYEASVESFTNIDAAFQSVDTALSSKASISSIEQAKTDIYGSAVSSFSFINTRFGTTDTAIASKANIAYVNEAVAEEALARSQTIALLGAENTGKTAFLLNQATVQVTPGASWASWEATLQATISSKATLTQWQEVKDSTDELYAKAGIQLNVNNYVTGWALHNDGESGEMVILADKFKVVNPASGGLGHTPVIPFQVEGGVVYMNTAFIKDLTVAKLTAGTINVPIDLTGSINIPNTGFIRSGQTAWNVGTGWWLGHVSGTPRFSIGNPTGPRIAYDGTTLQIAGTFSLVAASVLGQGTLATKNSVNLATGEVTNKSLANIDSAANTKLGGVATGATKNSVTSGTTFPVSGVVNGDLHFSSTAKEWYSRISGAWVKVADETASHQAASIAGQGALATKSSVNLATAEVTNKSLANVDSAASTKLSGIANNATQNSVTTGTAFPTGGVDGAMYYRTGATAPGWYSRISSVWQYVGDVTLTAINGSLNVTGGGINLASGTSSIRSGQTAYNTGNGWWLGRDNVNGARFSIGNGTNNYMRWDGTALRTTKAVIDQAELHNSPLATSSARIHTGGGRTAPFMIHDINQTSNATGFSLECVLGPYWGPSHSTGHNFKRLAYQNQDALVQVTFVCDTQGGGAPSAYDLDLYYRINGGAWVLSHEMGRAEGPRDEETLVGTNGNFVRTFIGRMTTPNTWNTLDLRIFADRFISGGAKAVWLSAVVTFNNSNQSAPTPVGAGGTTPTTPLTPPVWTPPPGSIVS